MISPPRDLLEPHDPLVHALSQRVQYLSEQRVQYLGDRSPISMPPLSSSPNPTPNGNALSSPGIAVSPSTDMSGEAEAALISMTQLLHASEAEKIQAQNALASINLDSSFVAKLTIGEKADLCAALQLDVGGTVQQAVARERTLRGQLEDAEAELHQVLARCDRLEAEVISSQKEMQKCQLLGAELDNERLAHTQTVQELCRMQGVLTGLADHLDLPTDYSENLSAIAVELVSRQQQMKKDLATARGELAARRTDDLECQQHKWALDQLKDLMPDLTSGPEMRPPRIRWGAVSRAQRAQTAGLPAHQRGHDHPGGARHPSGLFPLGQKECSACRRSGRCRMS
eukprot:TRINITY_DN43473_c0_g1_i1.p1 TRINITY_DN43473_c0_g1~~TRINITY_DN43473_c0_g1_i1.p1  ORF type:complete len:342 (-),score=78.67 TRINITY_DN43473_c0_g1_i1:208-1233(-)